KVASAYARSPWGSVEETCPSTTLLAVPAGSAPTCSGEWVCSLAAKVASAYARSPCGSGAFRWSERAESVYALSPWGSASPMCAETAVLADPAGSAPTSEGPSTTTPDAPLTDSTGAGRVSGCYQVSAWGGALVPRT